MSIFVFWAICSSTAYSMPCKLVSCPQSTGIDKVQFNLQHSSTQTLSDYFTIIRSTFFKSIDGRVIFWIEENTSELVYYQFNIKSHTIYPVDLASLSSKGFGGVRIKNSDHLKKFFSDTLVIPPTLELPVRLSDLSLHRETYFFISTCTETLGLNLNIPNRQDTLIISEALFKNLPNNCPVLLKNKSLSEKTLGKCVIQFLSSDDTNEIISIIQALRELYPLLDDDTLILMTQAIVSSKGRNYPKECILPYLN